MSKYLLLILVFVQINVAAKSRLRDVVNTAPAISVANKAQAPFLFTENLGQVADSKGIPQPDILFTAHHGGTKIFLTTTGIHYQFTKINCPAGYNIKEHLRQDREEQEKLRRQVGIETYRFSLVFEGANPSAKVRKELQHSYTENFYLAHCPEGITDVHSYKRLVYEDIYPGIDWVVYSTPQTTGMKYDFVVHPGADPSLIKIKVSDAGSVAISKEGELIMKTTLGTVTEHAPESFAAGKKISSRFVWIKGRVGFAVDAYDRSKNLTIDPSVVWATYYGGNSYDIGLSCKTDVNGNVYMSGETFSTTSIALNGFQNTYIQDDAFLVKFDSAGNRLWATYYGGDKSDIGWDCATDASGNVFMAGVTRSKTGIASGGFQNIIGDTTSSDAFLVKFNSTGNRLWATYYGGSGTEGGFSCVVNSGGDVHMIGETSSGNDISFNGHQNVLGGSSDAFIVKFNSAGARLWATYYGGSSNEFPFRGAIDNNGNVYVSGATRSLNGIAFGGFQNALASASADDLFLVKFNSAGVRIWGTYYGGSLKESNSSCAVDKDGNVYLAGETLSTSGIAAGGHQNTSGGFQDIFLVKFNSSGVRKWATYYGGSSSDIWPFCTTNTRGDVFVAGVTNSTSGIAYNGIHNNFLGAWDAFLVKFDSTGFREWGTYYGGNSGDYNYYCATANNHIYITGTSESTTGIASGGFQNTYGGNGDAYLVKITDSINNRKIITGIVTGSPFCAGDTLNIPFTSTGSFSSSNIYTVQLSDPTGSFASPSSIGLLLSNANSGNITAVIPAGVPAGTQYRTRIISSAPTVIGTDNGTDIVIRKRPLQPGPISGNSIICAGSGQVYTVNPVVGITYNWSIPPTWTGSSNTNIINTIAGNISGGVTVTASNACGTSPGYTLIVAVENLAAIPSVGISANGSFCSGRPVTFTAIPVNGGTSPTYQWKKNGVNVGTNSATYTDSIPQNNNIITLEMTSTLACAASATVFSNSITEIITPSVIPGININTQPPNTICIGTPVNFVANVTGGGLTPQYVWYKNGNLLAGVTGANYIDGALVSGDTLQVVLISSAACPATPLTYSNKLGVTVHPVVNPAVTITANPGTIISPGQQVTFTAAVINGGTTPIFQWLKNNTAIPGANNTSYTANNLNPGDIISARVESGAPCTIPPIITSNKMTIQGKGVGINSVGQQQTNVMVYPNPNSGRFTLSVKQDIVNGKQVEIEILNVLGQRIYHRSVTSSKKEWLLDISLEAAVSGVYMLKVALENIVLKVDRIYKL